MAKSDISREEAAGKGTEIQTVEDAVSTIAALYSSEPKRPDEVDVVDMAKEWSVSRSAARSRLSRLVDSGELSVRQTTVDGRRISVYRRVCE